ncbi:MAG: thioredoxin family protein [Aquisalinus sp.]|nr:thioredoxin family protein [Aquisalinus sp.]
MMMRLISVFLLGLCVMAACAQSASGIAPESQARATAVSAYDPETAFQPSNREMEEVDEVLKRAADDDKLALIVMGANWCHDSRGFVKTLNNKRLGQVISDRYEVLLVDVGYLQRGRDVIERFGMPVIYGTPTVLVVDPEAELLINRNDMHRWRDAARIDVDEAITYFTSMATPSALDEAAAAHAEVEPALMALYAEIDAFERAQAARIYGGFARLAPMLAMDHKDRPDHFNDEWDQVRDLRYAITGDLADLRAEARRRSEAGETDISLTYPDYPAFSWE